MKMLYQNRARRMEHAAQALAVGIVRVLKRNRVGVLYMEDLTGIREDMDFGPGNLLVHNFWVFRKLRKAVEAACARRGIATEAKPPRGTSSYCRWESSDFSPRRRSITVYGAARRARPVWGSSRYLGFLTALTVSRRARQRSP
ncbi:MAG: hypothetical protein M1598_01725 [Actinobacteria bacterium]|nr:hypothetical protein [Actinomycetota bacterium]